MSVLAGTVWGDLYTSHLYAIFKGRYVYFGETGHVPPARWRSHLSSPTDFIGKLSDVDPDEARRGGPIFFVGVHIGSADAEPATKQKIARRAIEAELHKHFLLNPVLVKPATELLSTPPACPVSHTFCFDRASVAQSVYGVIAEAYRGWLNRFAGAPAPPPVSAESTPSRRGVEVISTARHALPTVTVSTSTTPHIG
jgi:hypothetical protein